MGAFVEGQEAGGADAVYSGSQKCLSCTPGLSPITFSDKAIATVKARTHKCQRWFLVLNLLLGYWGETTRTYHHTAPTNSLYALHESLLMLQQEGLKTKWRASNMASSLTINVSAASSSLVPIQSAQAAHTSIKQTAYRKEPT